MTKFSGVPAYNPNYEFTKRIQPEIKTKAAIEKKQANENETSYIVGSSPELYRHTPGDSGKYYILESKDLGEGIIQVLSSRIGKGNAYTDFTELKVNCKSVNQHQKITTYQHRKVSSCRVI